MITKIAWFMLRWLKYFCGLMMILGVVFIGALMMIWISTHLGTFAVLFAIIAVFAGLMAGKVL